MSIFSFFQEVKCDEIAPSDEQEQDALNQALIDLTKLVASTEDYYKSFNFNHKLLEEFEKLKANIETLTTVVSNYFLLVSEFDFQDVKYNGYRSVFRIIAKCISSLSNKMRKLNYSVLINRDKYEQQCCDYIEFLCRLAAISNRLGRMMVAQRERRALFMRPEDDENVYWSLIGCYDLLESRAFYGPCLGFYLTQPCRALAKLFCSLQLGLGHATSSVKYQSNVELFLSTVVQSVHGWWKERQRGAEISALFRHASVSFCKQCWNLIDHPIVIGSSNLLLPNLPVVKEISLQPVELLMPRADLPEDTVKVSPPVAHCGHAEVKIRLLSNCRRKGMEWLSSGSREESLLDPSPCLLIHCHGGGFVAQSSQSHDGYLRQWAIDLSYPVVSIDYSHAPEFPYPRAHEECLYAYAWTLKNLGQLGCSPDCRIVMCGDSAGGNLVLGCILKVLQLNIRIPDGIFLAYPATLIDFVPSPARLIGAFCPILPIGVLARCLLAYSGVNEDCLIERLNREGLLDKGEPSSKENVNKCFCRDGNGSKEKKTPFSKADSVSPIVLLLNADIPKDPIMSPILADEELFKRFPPMSIFACEFDPLLDDSVEFCKKVSKAGANEVHLRVMRNLPHGFLNMATPVTKECMNATRQCIDEIKRLFLID